MTNKLKNLQSTLENHQIDGLLVTDPVNRKYITGFTGTAGVALITKNEALFITDFRYTEQAKVQAKHFKIIEHKKLLAEEINKQLNNLNVKRLGFEKNNVTYATFERYSKLFSADLVPVSSIIEEIRLIKTDQEIAIMKHAATIADAAFEHILDYIRPGVREVEIANELEFFMRKKGAASSSFDIIVASGFRSALPHGVASEKTVQTGELVTMDFGAFYNNYCSDITRTVAVGSISNELKEIYETVLEAQSLGVELIKPGMTGKEADAITRDYITKKGYGEFFGHSTGHGLGMEVHEGPGLTPRADRKLLPGMVVTVEPGIYVPDTGGCRIEDDIVITDTGNERLTHAPKHLIKL
ncbi:M24 family metallopeptidase [Virgibacillus sp. W0181]|uniref:M24 family metallopeptidase n=1 Tax=Virgibacillus sp. W0181 TaxID=3391581 RepID=UPI003F467EE2